MGYPDRSERSPSSTGGTPQQRLLLASVLGGRRLRAALGCIRARAMSASTGERTWAREAKLPLSTWPPLFWASADWMRLASSRLIGVLLPPPPPPAPWSLLPWPWASPAQVRRAPAWTPRGRRAHGFSQPAATTPGAAVQLSSRRLPAPPSLADLPPLLAPQATCMGRPAARGLREVGSWDPALQPPRAPDPSRWDALPPPSAGCSPAGSLGQQAGANEDLLHDGALHGWGGRQGGPKS